MYLLVCVTTFFLTENNAVLGGCEIQLSVCAIGNLKGNLKRNLDGNLQGYLEEDMGATF